MKVKSKKKKIFIITKKYKFKALRKKCNGTYL